VNIYRVTKKKYLNDLSGEGAKLYGGRWNAKGVPMLYCSENMAMCVLEILVHLDMKYLNDTYGYMMLKIPDEMVESISTYEIDDPRWRQNPPSELTISYGTKWIKSAASVTLRVPSAVLPHENNILINTQHPRFAEIEVMETGDLLLDNRLILE